MQNYIYILALALLTTHELDAIYRHEWRIFPFLNKLKENIAAYIFIIIHIPLFFIIFWLSFHSEPIVRTSSQIIIASFCIIHVGLHILLKNHKASEFNNPFSQFIIWSCGVAGTAFLGLEILF